ncbi:hypothetical protein JHK85_032387 [Glycine max]|nr:hypothetical protein JHK85_032387 [Glycine max]KAG4994991.1 hypothetical protein JHK86_031818 [Glycine max]
MRTTLLVASWHLSHWPLKAALSFRWVTLPPLCPSISPSNYTTSPVPDWLKLEVESLFLNDEVKGVTFWKDSTHGLLHALRRNNNPTATREVCATTNSVLASIFKGQTRWSCAILSNMICQWK